MATVDPSGLAQDVLYHVYAYWDGANVQLTVNTAPYTNSANNPLATQTSDPTHTFVGFLYWAPNNVIYTRSYFGDRSQYQSFTIDSLTGNVQQAAPYQSMKYTADKTLTGNTDLYNTSIANQTLYIISFGHELVDMETIFNFRQVLNPPNGTVTGWLNIDLVDKVTGYVMAGFCSNRLGGGITGQLEIVGCIRERIQLQTDTQPQLWKLCLHVVSFSYSAYLRARGAFDGYMLCTDTDVYPYQTNDGYTSSYNANSELDSGLYIRGYKQNLLPYL